MSSEYQTGFFENFAAYPFITDAEYQQGLAGILNSGALEGKSEEDQEDILLRAEIFYYNRLTGSSITLDEAKEARRRHSRIASAVVAAPSCDNSSPADDQRPSESSQPTLTFAQLKELIEQGRTDEIPNNKAIPNVLSSETPSESTAIVRKKPWETASASQDNLWLADG